MNEKDFQIISSVLPFSLLPEKELDRLNPQFAIETFKKGTVLFEQEKSIIRKIYILKQGAAERYFEQSREKTLRGRIDQNDMFGAVSILMNDSIAIRTFKLVEDCIFYTLDAAFFLRLCATYEDFKKFFVNVFNKQILNASYRYIVDKQVKEQEFTLPFFNQPIYDMFRPNLLSCPDTTTIKTAANKMVENASSCIFIKNSRKEITGIVTSHDLAWKVVAREYDTQKPVSDIMSSPLISIRATAQVFEAFLTIIEHQVKHLPISDQSGRIVGAITNEDLIIAQGNSPYLVIKEIKSAQKIEELENIHNRLPHLLQGPIKNGASPEHLTRLITTFADAILEKIIRFALEEAGPAPCEFAFMVMGSEGRKEQTLKTDQDNAIVFEDIQDPVRLEAAQQYFAMLSDFICTWLDKAGFVFCEGNNMASNPKWCQPLSVWKKYFFDWIHAADPEDLLYSSIFFDFRGVWGNLSLTEDLQSYLMDTLKGWPGFFRNLTENALYFKPPIGFFKNFILEKKGDHKDSFDIKRAMLPITDCARIYALKNGITEPNTLSRLFRLYTCSAMTQEEYTDITQAYNYMMNIRFMRQITAILDEKTLPDNYINPANLSDIDQTILKSVFKKIKNIQRKLNMEFIGMV